MPIQDPQTLNRDSVNGLITIASALGPKETVDRLVNEIVSKGLTVFARVDHAAGATKLGLSLRPTEVILFGNARGGTPLMQAAQTAGIDLPLKVLVWQDAANETWVSYNEPSWISQRHHLEISAEIIDKLTTVVRSIAQAATGKQ
jgi:uncharacterized protein (DUF302 family)